MSGTLSTRWFWSDWMSDPCVRACGYAARGLWQDMLCIAGMNKGREHGYVTINGDKLETSEIARMTGGAVEEVEILLEELGRKKVFSKDKRGVIYCRRMVRAEKNRGNGRLGGNPNLLKEKGKKNPVQPDPKPLIPEPKPEPAPEKKDKVASLRSATAAVPARGTRLPPDWKPSAADVEFALSLLQEDAVDVEVEKFRDHWHASSSRNAVKMKWDAAWRNWCRKAVEINSRGGNHAVDRRGGGFGGGRGGGEGFAAFAARRARDAGGQRG